MKTGLELIAEERQEQIEKHGHTIELDVKLNKWGQLIHAASLLSMDMDLHNYKEHALINPPHGWNKEIWEKMVNKPHLERLIIAGALFAAEIDRIQSETQV